ncbi:immunity 22 family protein [Bacillus sp. TL12]|uniref:immunity 22 family protein n=1 Tax=Bacillus sp. TL12 TaxID=2894756 RepID=UPI001F5234D0|nr:immunity 22 family protein [Bacillus sp. TL12]MCI0765529.1 immunity 22 family protein [Bacillus sp. TL12]
MEKEGMVSLWLGNIESEDFLEDYFHIKYTEDGDSILSPFIKDYHICMYDIDEDFIEIEFYLKRSDHLETLLAGCSYEEVVIPQMKRCASNMLEMKYNTIIMIYNYEYSGEITNKNENRYEMKYIGAVPYK